MAKLKFPDLSKMLKTEEIPDFLKPYLKFLGLGIPSNLMHGMDILQQEITFIN